MSEFKMPENKILTFTVRLKKLLKKPFILLLKIDIKNYF